MMPRDCQIVLFSATYSSQVRSFAGRFAPNANQFSLKVEELSVKTINQFYMDCQNEQHKFQVLDDLYTLLKIEKSIIFVKVCWLTKYLCEQFKKKKKKKKKIDNIKPSN